MGLHSVSPYPWTNIKPKSLKPFATFMSIGSSTYKQPYTVLKLYIWVKVFVISTEFSENYLFYSYSKFLSHGFLWLILILLYIASNINVLPALL